MNRDERDIRGVKNLFIISGLTAVLFMFQNCQQSSFSSGSADQGHQSKTIGEFVAIESQDSEDSANGQISQPAAEEPGSAARDRGGYYVCILDGPGKSVKLGATEAGDPQGQNGIPGVICMTKNACLNIISDYFDVKGPEFRGYCKGNGNPNVIYATDNQIKEKIETLKLSSAQ
jgi:hypothetical protein